MKALRAWLRAPLLGLVAMSQLMIVSPVLSQELPWTHVTSEHQMIPLPSASVQKVRQDRQGFVWLGFFSAGLARYDGRSLEIYDIPDGLADSTVREVVEDRDGYLWVGSESGLVVSDRPLSGYDLSERVRFVSEIDGERLVRTRIRHSWVVTDPAGGVWVATAGKGLIHYRVDDQGRLEQRVVDLDLRHDGRQAIASAMTARRDGTVLLGTEGGEVVVLAPGETRPRRMSLPGLDGRVVVALHEGPTGTVWGGCRNGLVWRLDESREPRLRTVSTTLGERVSALLEDRNGVLWVASLGAGLLKIDPSRPGNALHITRQLGLLSESVWDLLEDHEGNLWVAHNAGFSRLRTNYHAFGHYTGYSRAGEEPLLPEPSVFTALPPPGGGGSGFTWVGTGGGLAAIGREGVAARLGTGDGLMSGSIYALGRDGAGRIWIGTLAGLNVLSFEAPQPATVGGLPPSRVRVGSRSATLGAFAIGTVYECKMFPLAAAAGGTTTVESVWLAGTNGLACHADGRWFFFRTQAGIPGSGSSTVALEPSGDLWVGSRDSGILRSTQPVTLERLENLVTGGPGAARREIVTPVLAPYWNTSTGAPSDSIHNFAWAGGRMWVATAAGLVTVAGSPAQTELRLGRGTGLGGDRIMGMALSPVTGSLWVTQNDGVAEVDPGTGEVLRTVSKRDGLVDNEVWVSSSLAVGHDGTVFVSTPKGLSMYRPWLDSDNQEPPLLRFRRASFRQDGHGQNELDVQYCALSFANEQAVRFKTRLVGFDSDWSAETADVKLRYTNLPAFLVARRYTFEVNAANNDGVWAKEPLRFDFRVRPAMWLRWWAVVGYLSVLLAGVWLYSRGLRVRNRELEQRVEERTRDLDTAYRERRAEREGVEEALAASSESVAALSGQLSSTAEETAQQAKVVSESADDVNSSVQTVSVAIEELSANVKEIASNANEAAGIAQTGVGVAEEANSTVTALVASSAEINAVIDLIDSIARQTNLLALNATIEAARAGEAGRGFSVVAREVKELATETARATDDVLEKVQTLQADSARAVEAIAGISAIIQRINEIQVAISVAVEEHTMTARDIARNVTQAAQGSADITAGIAGVAEAADGTTAGASSALQAAAELAELAARLRASSRTRDFLANEQKPGMHDAPQVVS